MYKVCVLVRAALQSDIQVRCTKRIAKRGLKLSACMNLYFHEYGIYREEKYTRILNVRSSHSRPAGAGRVRPVVCGIELWISWQMGLQIHAFDNIFR